MTSRICKTSWSLSWLTRRSSGILTFSRMSAAFFWPMPWMYWSAIRTRLLVGIFTPAIRATDFSPVADPSWDTAVFCYFGQVSANTNTTPFPLDFPGPGIVKNYPTWIPGLLKDSTWFRQPSLSFSSPFSDLFRGFSGLPGGPCPGTCDSLAGRRFCPLGGRFPGLSRVLGALPGSPRASGRGFGCLSGSGFGALSGPFGDSLGRGHLGCLGLHGSDCGQNAVNFPRHVFDGHHAIDREQLAPLRIVVNQRLGLRTVARQPLRQHLRGVVDAHLLAARPHLGGPVFNALQQRAFVDAKLDHGIEFHFLLLQELIQRFRLRHRAWKAVEDKALGRIRLIQPVGNDSNHDVVRHQAAAGHDVLGLEADRRLR